MIVVTDTSVLLNLCFLHREAILTELFGTVVAPPSVREEFERLAGSDSRFRGLVFPSFIRIEKPAGIAPALASNHRLHRGELDALSLAAELTASAVLMDERAGRAAGAELGLRSIGILGILIQAKNLGLVPAVGPLLDQLHAGARFWIAPALKLRVLGMAGE